MLLAKLDMYKCIRVVYLVKFIYFNHILTNTLFSRLKITITFSR